MLEITRQIIEIILVNYYILHTKRRKMTLVRATVSKREAKQN